MLWPDIVTDELVVCKQFLVPLPKHRYLNSSIDAFFLVVKIVIHPEYNTVLRRRIGERMLVDIEYFDWGFVGV